MTAFLFFFGLCLGGVIVLGGLALLVVLITRTASPPPAPPPPTVPRFMTEYQDLAQQYEQEFTAAVKRTFKKVR